MLAGSLLWMLPLYGHSGGSSLNLPTFVGAVSVDQPEVDAEQTALTARERALPGQTFPKLAVEAVTLQVSLFKQAASTIWFELEEVQSA